MNPPTSPWFERLCSSCRDRGSRYTPWSPVPDVQSSVVDQHRGDQRDVGPIWRPMPRSCRRWCSHKRRLSTPAVIVSPATRSAKHAEAGRSGTGSTGPRRVAASTATRTPAPSTPRPAVEQTNCSASTLPTFPSSPDAGAKDCSTRGIGNHGGSERQAKEVAGRRKLAASHLGTPQLDDAQEPQSPREGDQASIARGSDGRPRTSLTPHWSWQVIDQGGRRPRAYHAPRSSKRTLVM
jgi:hypothetical protein